VFTVLEPCRTFSFRFEKGKPFVASARRKCLFVYYYFMDRDFGLIHVKLQTWFPLPMQIYVTGMSGWRGSSSKMESGFANRKTPFCPWTIWAGHRSLRIASARWTGHGC
jgi:hypothetical protein